MPLRRDARGFCTRVFLELLSGGEGDSTQPNPCPLMRSSNLFATFCQVIRIIWLNCTQVLYTHQRCVKRTTRKQAEKYSRCSRAAVYSVLAD